MSTYSYQFNNNDIMHRSLSLFFISIYTCFCVYLPILHPNKFYATDEAYAKEEKSVFVLNLPEAISRALNDNYQMIENREGLTTSRYGIEMSASEFDLQMSPNGRAGYVGGGHVGTGWSIGGGIDISKRFTSGTQISLEPSLLKFPDHYHNEIKAVITQPLLRGLGKEYQISGILAAQFNKRTAYRNLYIAQVKLIIRTIQSMYEIVKEEKSVLLNQESYDRIHHFYRAAKLKEKIGLSDPLDTNRAETELRTAEDELATSRERLQEAVDVLREILSLPLDARFKIEVPLIFNPQMLDAEKAIQLALENRIEMDQNNDQCNENRRLARIAKKNTYPELNLVLNYSNYGRNEIFTRAWTRHRESTWGVGFTTSADFNPLAESIAYEQSLLDVVGAERGCIQTESSLILEVKRTLRRLKMAYQKIFLQEQQIKSSQGELFLAQLKFNHGMADNFYIIRAEKNLRRAQQAYWNAIIDHIIGEFQLLATMGLLIDKPKIP